MKKIPFNINAKKILHSRDGQANYIEYSIGIIMLLVLLSIVVQVYGLVNTESVILNVAEDDLRRVELNGGKPAGVDFTQELKNKLGNKAISNINVTVPTGPIQLRNPITIIISANYSFTMFGLSVATVPIAVSYTGSSEKFNKTQTYNPLLN